MKKSTFVCSLLCILLSACDAPQINTLSETEAKGVSSVTKTFGSTVKCRQILSTSSSEGNARVFSMRIDSLSATMQPYKAHPFLLSSNAALLFYEKLTEEEKHRFTHIHVILPFDTEGMDTYKYSVELLDTLVRKTPLLEKVINYAVNKDYEGIFSKFDSELEPSKLKQFRADAKENEAIFDDLTGNYFPLGFEFYEVEGELMYGRFFGSLMGKKQNVQFSIDFPLDAEIEKISAFRFSHKF